MISIIEREIVDKYHWIERDDFLDLLAVAQSLPGILAVNIATAVGDKLRGTRGSIIASAGTILPSFLIILAIAIFLTPDMIKNNRVISSIFMGIRPAVVALIIAPVLTSAKAAKIGLKTVWIPLVVALMISLDLGFISNPILYILFGGFGGFLSGGYPANTALKPYSAPYSPIHPHNPITPYTPKTCKSTSNSYSLHKDRHLRIRRRLRHAFACGKGGGSSRMDLGNHVYRHSGDLSDDTQSSESIPPLISASSLRSRKPEFSGIGWGLIGSILATLAVTVPSFFLVLYSAHFIRRHNESGAVKAVFSGLRPVVVGLIASAAIMLMNAANFNPNGITRQMWMNIAICAVAFCLAYFSR